MGPKLTIVWIYVRFIGTHAEYDKDPAIVLGV
ncbi:MAG: type II toxin-antitoxin system HigB family toxin [Muribaculaceae bacterium]|nr:type II toxin-antitoxin system HigB family toxin [Muribaculaceae bacterium]